MKICLSSDTSCLINYGVLEKFDIKVFPLNVIIDGEEYLDGVSINQEQLRDAMRGKKTIKTSTPPLGQIINYFEELFEQGYDRIIHFTISSKLSSMNELFTSVSKNYFDDKIIVIDSLGLSTYMLSQVILAYDELQQGTDIEKLCEKIEEQKKAYDLIFVPENLTALKNGGRVSPAVAAVGNVLGIKPVIKLIDGELVKVDTTRNVVKTFKQYIDEQVNEYPIADYDYFVVEFDANHNYAEQVYQYIEEKFPGYKVKRGIIPINVCAHCGPGTIGILISKKVNGKALNEYL